VFHLDELGWNAFFQQYLKAGASHVPGRVVEEQRSTFRVACEAGELTAESAGRLRHTAVARSALPAVGDWVLIEPRVGEGRATIHEVLPRKTKFSRKSAGRKTVDRLSLPISIPCSVLRCPT